MENVGHMGGNESRKEEVVRSGSAALVDFALIADSRCHRFAACAFGGTTRDNHKHVRQMWIHAHSLDSE